MNVTGHLHAQGGSGGAGGAGNTHPCNQATGAVNGYAGGGGGGGRIVVISPNLVQGVSPSIGTPASGSTGGNHAIAIQQVAACTPIVTSIQVNGQATNTVIAGTSGSMSIHGSCLGGARWVQSDGSGVEFISISYTADGRVDVFFEASGSASGGIQNVIVTTVNGTSGACSNSQVFVTRVTLQSFSVTNSVQYLRDCAGRFALIVKPTFPSGAVACPQGSGFTGDHAVYASGDTMRGTAVFSLSPVPSQGVTGTYLRGDRSFRCESGALIMKFDSLLFVSVCVPLLAQDTVSQVAFSESRDIVTAFSSSGALNLPVVHLQLDIVYSNSKGKKERRDLSVSYDSQNRYYLWRLGSFPTPAQTGRFTDTMKANKEMIYADADGLVDFLFRSDLWVKVYKSRADSLDAAARAAVAEIPQGLAFIARYQPRRGPSPPTWPWDHKPVDLGRSITADLGCFPMRANCSDDFNKIVSIRKQGTNWRIVLRNRWDQEVILDPSFNLVITQRITTP